MHKQDKQQIEEEYNTYTLHKIKARINRINKSQNKEEKNMIYHSQKRELKKD